MAVSTTKLILLAFLIIVLGVAIYWLVVSKNYQKSINNFVYARGANYDPGSGGDSGQVEFKCDGSRKICLDKATAYCTGTNGKTNSEFITGAYARGDFGIPYGNFDTSGKRSDMAIDITKDVAKQVNGKTLTKFTFDGEKIFSGKCKNFCQGCTIRPQIIATYTCIPKSSSCNTK